MFMAKIQRKIRPGVNSRLLKKKISQELKTMYIPNPAMHTDIDSYNYGIHDSLEKIKKIL
jgi:hypothetical protein